MLAGNNRVYSDMHSARTWYMQSVHTVLAHAAYSGPCGSARWPRLQYPRMLLALVLEFESHRGDIVNFFAKIEKDQLLRASIAWVGAIRRESTREERAEIFSR